MFAGKTYDLPAIRSYADAHNFFEKTNKPRRSVKWSEHQRPLKGTGFYHYRIEQGAQALYYDLVLYSTVMARFHKPDAEGVEHRQYKGDGSQTSRGFMWNVLRVDEFTSVKDTEDVARIMPVYTKALPQSRFSVEAFFAPGDKLMVGKSQHTRHFREVSSAEDKARRRDLKQAYESLIMLAAMRIPEWTHNAPLDYNAAGRFSTTTTPYVYSSPLKHLGEDMLQGREPWAADINDFMKVAERVFVKCASDDAHANGLLKWASPKGMTHAHTGLPPINEQTYSKALWRKLSQLTDCEKRSAVLEYPQFPEPNQLVRSNVTLIVPNNA